MTDKIELAKELIKRFGSYKKTAEAFGVSKAAVSQWVAHGLPDARARDLQHEKEAESYKKQIDRLKKKLHSLKNVSER